MAKRVGRFNGDKVPSYMQAYNEEMDTRGVDDVLRLEFFYRIAAPRVHEEVKVLGKAHSSWKNFERALWRAYGEPPRSWNRRGFDQWVASAKTHSGVTKAFQDFGRRFTRLPEREQRLVGADKVLLFVRTPREDGGYGQERKKDGRFYEFAHTCY